MHPSRPLTTSAVRALAHAVAVVLLAGLGLVVLGAGPAAAADDAPWAVRTASNEFGSSRPNYSYTLNPGGHLEDGLVVVNHGTTPLDLALYAADGFTTDAGRLDLVTKDATSTGVGAWVHASRDHVTIQPGKSAEVPFTVTLPANATPGDHLGGIVTSLTQASAAGSTKVERRLAIRIRLRVGGEFKPSLSVKDVHVDYSSTLNPFGKGDATITYTIHNTGNAILAARQAASISGPFGRLRVRSDEVDDSPQLLPGDTWTVSVPIHEVAPTVPLTGTVTLVPLLTDASSSIAPLTAVETTTHARTIPTALVLFVILCGLAVVVLAARRRRQAKLGEDARVQGAPRADASPSETSDQ
jgi:hypothetical protein